MTLFVAYAIFAGLLVGLSRQLNGRLAISTTPLIASFFNHIVGFAFLTILGLALGNLILPGATDAPWWVYFGGPLGVIFVTAGSWLIPRIGAVNSALLVIGGQMVTGVIFDLVRGAPMTFWASALGVALILGGVALTQRQK
ncbi:DMT family transporter [Devosia faecipullorum]|uniref:DMT family transporter n=1 Tax=Devosia faecipullorum TaxID=2755039 RepID=UPI00187B419D|nr:DMT family transporter [Devosia faecipullorum]MBE7732323.1 DMT family transporter [Devosia faecipullorum]